MSDEMNSTFRSRIESPKVGLHNPYFGYFSVSLRFSQSSHIALLTIWGVEKLKPLHIIRKQIERFHRSLKSALKARMNQSSWLEHLLLTLQGL